MKPSRTRERAAARIPVLLLSTILIRGFSPSLADSTPPPKDARLSPRLLQMMGGAGADQQVPVLVTTLAPAQDSDEADARSAGAQVRRRFAKLSGYAASIPVGSLSKLAALPGVSNVSFDSDIAATNDLNYVTVGADTVSRTYPGFPSGLDGAGVTVAVVDSGVASHPDLGSRLVTEVEIVGHEKGFADPYGHGTHVAGIIAGDGTSSSDPKSFRRFNGIAPKARVVSVRVLDENGGGKVSDVLAGIDWVLANKDKYGIRILNLSLGHPVEEPSSHDPLCRAVEAAWRGGILVVAAAGNSGAQGYETIHSPGDDPAILTVGASNNFRTPSRADDILTTYSSLGPTPFEHVVKPDLLAPGNRTLSLRAVGSTLDEAFPSLRVKQGEFRDDPGSAGSDSLYFQMSGSSMAAGVVSGMAALMIEANPSLTPDTLKARLMKSAEKHLVYDVFSEGAGFVDLIGALAEPAQAEGPALSPTVQWTDSGLSLQDTGMLWQDASNWDLVSLFGSDPLRATGGVWDDSSLWADAAPGGSTSSVSGNSVIWGGGMKGSGSTSGTSTTGADSVIWGGGMKSSGSSGTTTLGADSVIWGGGMKSSTGSTSTTITADSVIWGGGLKTTLTGDPIPQGP